MKTLICPFCYGRTVHGAHHCDGCRASIRYGLRHYENWSLYFLLFCGWVLLLGVLGSVLADLPWEKVLAGQGPQWPLWTLPPLALALTLACIWLAARRAPKLPDFRLARDSGLRPLALARGRR